MSTRLLQKNRQAGITLIEMLVVIIIFLVVAGTLMFNYSSFQTSVSVRNLSQDVALAIRKAQTYATSVRLSDTGFNTDSFTSYGIAFSLNNSAQFKMKYLPYNKQFTLFADIPDASGKGDKLFYGGTTCGVPYEGQECVEVNTITSGDKITKLCYQTSSSLPEDCSAQNINIIFKRPVPDADICIAEIDGCKNVKVSYVAITLESPQQQKKIVTVWNTGQISVK